MASVFRPGETVHFGLIHPGAAVGVARKRAVAGLPVIVMEEGPRRRPADLEHEELERTPEPDCLRVEWEVRVGPGEGELLPSAALEALCDAAAASEVLGGAAGARCAQAGAASFAHAGGHCLHGRLPRRPLHRRLRAPQRDLARR